MKKIIVLFLFAVVLFFPNNAYAVYDPTQVSNNRVGIHVIDTHDLNAIRELVGEWGYVTFVIQNGERDYKRWQEVMDEMRRLHLIPIIRIATQPAGTLWEKPKMDEIDGWVGFLNSLNWVIKNRYIVIGNEPNHSKEWGGDLKPEEYAKYLKKISEKLKAADEDFFIMPAGFDASAPNSRETMDEGQYIQKMFESDPNVFDFIDGWSSHSYPNPGFSGGGDDYGRGTVRTFEWELNFLKNLGFQKELPVFITETGWVHDGENIETNIGQKIDIAFKNAWNKKNVIAVTPFIYKYTDLPFNNFSWTNKDGKFYDFYYTVKNLLKDEAEPIQIVSADILTGIMPRIATSNSEYHSVLFVKNTGQSIWRVNNLGAVNAKNKRLTIQSMIPETIEPGQVGVFLLNNNFPSNSGDYEEWIALIDDGKLISNWFKSPVTLIPEISKFTEIVEYIKTLILRRR